MRAYEGVLSVKMCPLLLLSRQVIVRNSIVSVCIAGWGVGRLLTVVLCFTGGGVI